MAVATKGSTTVSVTVGGQEMTFETGKLAKQADGAVVVRSGETMVLATAQGRTEAREGADFFPLTVDVEERMYAAGKIPGGFFKREGRPTERAILTARMIDRPIRPLWPKGFRNEVQVICTVLSADMVTPHDILCINGASTALMISPLPFFGPVGAVRIGMIDGELVVNPTLDAIENESTLDLIVVGTKDGLTMVEAGADEIPEDVLLEAFELAHAEIVKICEAQEELAREVGKPKWLDMELVTELEQEHGGVIRRAHLRAEGLREAGAIVEELTDELCPPLSMESTEEDITRQMQVRSALNLILETGSPGDGRRPGARAVRGRPALADRGRAGLEGAQVGQAPAPVRPDHRDGRAALPGRPGDGRRRGAGGQGLPDQAVRQAGRGGDLQGARPPQDRGREAPPGRPRDGRDPPDHVRGRRRAAHARLGLFTRGQTQIMSLLTLGTAKEGQRIDDLSLETDRRYMHHYNFPPYSVGETGFMRGPKRRDIGHGALAQRASSR